MDDLIRQQIMTKLTVPVTVAGKAFGIGRNASYEQARTGRIGSVAVIDVGGKRRVPTAPLRKVLGLEPV
jgi:hypothetical protein